MILADKIIKLRKQFGWSQEELAEKMNVSRQSVSKWESANSIPDLNKILLLAEIFGVSTDYLVKDEIEEIETITEDREPNVVKITLEEANDYVTKKVEMSKLVAKGVLLAIFSVVPLIFLLALSEDEYLTSNTATALGLVLLFVFISVAVSIFIRSNQYEHEFGRFEKEEFELVYGVRSVFKEKMKSFRPTYVQRVSLCVTMFITSVVPLLLVGLLMDNDLITLMMLVVLLLMVAAGVFLIIPVSTQHTAYSLLIGEGEYSNNGKASTKRSEQFAGFYWPLVTAIYIGWSLWTMAWGITWIVWPVAGIAFAAFVALIDMFDNKNGR